MPDDLTPEEVREVQTYTDKLTVAAMTLHDQIETELGPVSRYDEDGNPLIPHYTLGSYMALLNEAVETEDIYEVEHMLSLILASYAIIKGAPLTAEDVIRYHEEE